MSIPSFSDECPPFSALGGSRRRLLHSLLKNAHRSRSLLRRINAHGHLLQKNAAIGSDISIRDSTFNTLSYFLKGCDLS